jgi:hypothetical protein
VKNIFKEKQVLKRGFILAVYRVKALMMLKNLMKASEPIGALRTSYIGYWT